MQTLYCSDPGGPLHSASFLYSTRFPFLLTYHHEKFASVVGGATAEERGGPGRAAAAPPEDPAICTCSRTCCTTQCPTRGSVCSAPSEMSSPRFKLSSTAALPFFKAQTWCLSSGSSLACCSAARMALSKAGRSPDSRTSSSAARRPLSATTAEDELRAPPPRFRPPPPPSSSSSSSSTRTSSSPCASKRRRFAALPSSDPPSSGSSGSFGGSSGSGSPPPRSSKISVARLQHPTSWMRASGATSLMRAGGVPTFSTWRSDGTPVSTAISCRRPSTVQSSGTPSKVTALPQCRTRSVISAITPTPLTGRSKGKSRRWMR
mmetsp:Transcript_34719/g.98561  ORF Transcript_34719/g.98561 Transcript_34719/m.98561 type:complete len:319 (-) Transcript_34719:12-968(-)